MIKAILKSGVTVIWTNTNNSTHCKYPFQQPSYTVTTLNLNLIHLMEAVLKVSNKREKNYQMLK